MGNSRKLNYRLCRPDERTEHETKSTDPSPLALKQQRQQSPAAQPDEVLVQGTPWIAPCRCRCFSSCHSRRESASAVVLAFLVVIPEGNLRLPLSLLFWLLFPKGICVCRCPCFSGCYSRRESASAVALAFLVVIPEGNLRPAVAIAFLVVIPEGNLRLPLSFVFAVAVAVTRQTPHPAFLASEHAKNPANPRVKPHFVVTHSFATSNSMSV